MSIVEKKFGDCEKEGLQHSWKLFEIHKGGYNCNGGSISPLAGYSDTTEVPAPEGPEPFIKNETTHVKKCKNCIVEELFEVKETRKWVRK